MTYSSNNDTLLVSNRFLIENRKYAGYWKADKGNVRFAINKKPRWLTRKMAKIFFELDWIDEKL